MTNTKSHNVDRRQHFVVLNCKKRNIYFHTGLSQVEKKHFSDMRNKIQRLRAPAGPAATFVKSMAPFCLQYLYPKCPAPKCINGKNQNLTMYPTVNMCRLHADVISVVCSRKRHMPTIQNNLLRNTCASGVSASSCIQSPLSTVEWGGGEH